MKSNQRNSSLKIIISSKQKEDYSKNYGNDPEMQTLKEMLNSRKMFKNITTVSDIETHQDNEKAGKEQPSAYTNMTFSVAVSWMNQGQVNYEIFPNFKELFDVIINVFKNVKNKPNITLNAHNTNKYDNHFLRYDLMHYYNLPVENYYLNTATTETRSEERRV